MDEAAPKWSKDMSEEERKAYNAHKKKQSRELQKKKKLVEFHQAVAAEVEARAFEQSDDIDVPVEQAEQLSRFSSLVKEQIQAEIGSDLTDYGPPNETYIVQGLAEISHGLEKKFILRAFNPFGVRVGNWYIDALGSEAIEFYRKNTRLNRSQKFLNLYRKTLKQIVDFFQQEKGKNNGAAEAHWLEEIKRELA